MFRLGNHLIFSMRPPLICRIRGDNLCWQVRVCVVSMTIWVNLNTTYLLIMSKQVEPFWPETVNPNKLILCWVHCHPYVEWYIHSRNAWNWSLGRWSITSHISRPYCLELFSHSEQNKSSSKRSNKGICVSSKFSLTYHLWFIGKNILGFPTKKTKRILKD